MGVPLLRFLLLQIFRDDEFAHFDDWTIANDMSPTLPAMAREARPLFDEHPRRCFGQVVVGKAHPLEPVIAVRDDSIDRRSKIGPLFPHETTSTGVKESWSIGFLDPSLHYSITPFF
jgi:hypothetical protein